MEKRKCKFCIHGKRYRYVIQSNLFVEYAGDIVLMDHDKKKVEYTMESIRETTDEE